jgi:hypothetical protein
MKAHRQIGLIALAALIATQAGAAQYVYPTQGQDKAKQAKDEADCAAWATQQTGFDPAKASTASSAGGAGLSGTAAAAAMGAIPGASNLAPAAAMLNGGGQAASVTNLGAAASSISGLGGQAGGASQALGMLGQASGQPKAAKPGQADYDQARAACLSGRGYSVR